MIESYLESSGTDVIFSAFNNVSHPDSVVNEPQSRSDKKRIDEVNNICDIVHYEPLMSIFSVLIREASPNWNTPEVVKESSSDHKEPADVE